MEPCPYDHRETGSFVTRGSLIRDFQITDRKSQMDFGCLGSGGAEGGSQPHFIALPIVPDYPVGRVLPDPPLSKNEDN